MMKHILLAFIILLSFNAFAQPSKFNDGIGLWRETDCPAYALRLIAKNEGRINDTVPPLLAKGEKTIYILKEPYFKNMPDTVMGYKVVYINADSDTRYWYKKQQEEHIHIYYFSKMFLFYEFYQFWIIPVEMKKKEVWYSNKVYRLFFYFHQELTQYEYKRTDYFEWDPKKGQQTKVYDFR